MCTKKIHVNATLNIFWLKDTFFLPWPLLYFLFILIFLLIWLKTFWSKNKTLINISVKLFCCGCYCVCMHVCLLTLVSEGRRGRGWGNRGSRCRDRTLANGLLQHTPSLHLVNLILYRDTEKGGMKHDEGQKREKVEIHQGKQEEIGERRRAVENMTEGGGYHFEAFYLINIIAQPSAW